MLTKELGQLVPLRHFQNNVINIPLTWARACTAKCLSEESVYSRFKRKSYQGHGTAEKVIGALAQTVWQLWMGGFYSLHIGDLFFVHQVCGNGRAHSVSGSPRRSFNTQLHVHHWPSFTERRPSFLTGLHVLLHI